MNNKDNLNYVFICLALQVLLLSFSSLINYLHRLIQISGKFKIKYHIDQLIVNKITSQPLEFFDQSTSYDNIQRANAGQRGVELFEDTLQIFQYVISLISFIIIIASFHVTLALIALIFCIPLFFINYSIGGRKYNHVKNQTPSLRKTNYLFGLLCGREAAKELKIFGASNYLIKLWDKYYWKNCEETYLVERKNRNSLLLIDFLGIFANVTMLIGLIILLWLTNSTIGTYVAIAQAIGSTQSILLNISNSIGRCYETLLHVSDFFNFIDNKFEFSPVKKINVQMQQFPQPLKTIEVRNLNFSYYNGKTEIQVLKNITFSIKAGQKIAIVGENGSGKSTLVKCLLNLYDLKDDCIYFNDVNIKNIDVQSFNKNVSAVFQDYCRFYLTVRENIGIGNLEKITDMSALEAAAAKADINTLISGLPNGFETQLGPLFYGGVDLSLGQWQRIAIARAFLRDAQLIILDEPTASLDPLIEAEIFENLSQLTVGKTTIFISHRMGSCKWADKIFVMKSGHICEEGSHEELIKLNGEYARLYNSQAQWYE